MAQIPSYRARRIGIDPAATSPRVSPDVAAAPGRAIAQLGQAVEGFALAQVGFEQDIRRQRKVEAVARATEDMTRWVGETKLRYAQDPDFETWQPRFEAEARAFGQALERTLPDDPDIRRTVGHLFTQKALTTGFELGGRALGRRIDRGKARTLGAVEAIEAQAAETLNPIEQRDLEAGMELALQNAVAVGFMDEMEAERRRQSFATSVQRGRRKVAIEAATSWAMRVGAASAVAGLEAGRTGDPELDAALAELPLADRRAALNTALAFRRREQTAANAADAAERRRQRLAVEQIQRDLVWEEDPEKRLQMLQGLRDVEAMPATTYRRLVEAELREGPEAKAKTNQETYLRLFEAAAHGQTTVETKVGNLIAGGESLYDAVTEAFAEGELTVADRNRLLGMVVGNRNKVVSGGARYLRGELKGNPLLYMLNPSAMPEGIEATIDEYYRKVRADPKADPMDVAKEIAAAAKPKILSGSGDLMPNPDEAAAAHATLSATPYLAPSHDETMQRLSDALAAGEIEIGELLEYRALVDTLKRADAWEAGGIVAEHAPPSGPGLFQRLLGGLTAGSGPAPGESFTGPIPPAEGAAP